MKLYSLHAAAFFISLSFHTNILDAIILAEAVLRHAVVEVDEEYVAQGAIFQKDRLHIGDLLAVFCCLLDDGKAHVILLLHSRRDEERRRHRKGANG